jgi:hypothetical protein
MAEGQEGTSALGHTMTYKDNKYTARIRVTPDNLEWLKKFKGKKSAAAFLEDIIKAYQHEKEIKK